MQLISQTAVTSGPATPRHPPVYPAPADLALENPLTFQNGPPYDAFAHLRQTAPVAWLSTPSDNSGFWALTRFDDVSRANADPETFSSQRGGILLSAGAPEARHPLLFRASLDAMINMDQPWHLNLRREHMPFFTPAYVNRLKERVGHEITTLIDGMAPLGACDLVEHVSSRLPLFTLCEILGVPVEDRPKFLKWMHYLELAGNLAADRSKGELALTPELMMFIQAFNENVEAMFEYGRDILHKRRQDPQPDLLSAIARAQLDGEFLADEYLDGSWLLIVFAGNDTTRNTISGSVKLMTEFPDQKARLAADRSLLPNAVNEFIRMVSPVIYMRRTATKDVEIGGQMIAEGEKVAMYYGAANRDPSVFADPDRLDIGRANADKHLAFGFGPHVCIGKRVAQMQLEAVWEQFLTRLPDLEYAGGIDVAPNNFVYAIRKLPVTFTPAAKVA